MNKSNHAVGECYKATGQYKAGEFIDLRRDLNIHDPENAYQWADELDRKKLLWNSITIGGAALFSVIILGVML
jgi:hypothetical protein